jgi:hypothetical protein
VTDGNTKTIPCLQAFYGARSRSRSRKRKNTAKSLISPGERPQEIYTPHAVVEALLRIWPHIALDPCSGPGSVVGALDTFYIPERIEQVRDKKGNVVLDDNGEPKTRTYYRVEAEGEIDGLTREWVDYAYCNPPFKNLKPWLAHAERQGEAGRETAMLAPTRGNRSWFRDATRRATSVIDLDPLAFLGHKSTFPAPLCMLYWGAMKQLFEFAFEALGDAR